MHQKQSPVPIPGWLDADEAETAGDAADRLRARFAQGRVRLDVRRAPLLRFAFNGLVASADCPGETLRLVSSERSATDTDVYVVRLDSSSLHDANGMPVSCDQLTVGEAVALAGSVNADGTFGNCDIVVEP